MKADRLFSEVQRMTLVGLTGLVCWSLLWGATHALTDSADLGRRIEEMTLFRQGIDPYTDPDATYPPSAWLVFLGLIPDWPEPLVRILWLILNLGTLAALIEGLRRWLPEGRTRFWIASVMLTLMASKPVRAGLALGQFHLIPSALAVWAVVLARQGRFRTAGVLLGLALVKPTMVLPILGLWLVLGHHRAILTAGLVQATLWIGASIRLQRSPLILMKEWLRNAHTQEAAGTIDLPTLLNRWNLDTLMPMNLTTLLMLSASIWLFLRLRKADEFGLASLALVISALFAYHRHYDLVLLMPASAWLASRASHSWRSVLAMGLGVFLIVPVHIGPMKGLEPIYDQAFLTLCYGFTLALILELRTNVPNCREGLTPPDNPRLENRGFTSPLV